MSGRLRFFPALFAISVSSFFGVNAFAQGMFKPAVIYAAGGSPTCVVQGDFNRDGKIDLAVTNPSSNTVSILLANGDGTFQPPVSYAAHNLPEFIAVADLNRDGRLDLIVSNYSSNDVSILLGNGDGTFGAATNYPSGMQPFQVAVGDFNGDGKLDLAVADSATNSLGILLGNGDGSFQVPVSLATGGFPTSVAVTDLNHDGKLDLIVVANGVYVHLGNGNGTFQAGVSYPAGAASYQLAVGDLNGDGIPDVAVANSVSNDVSILLGYGDGTLQPAVNYGTGIQPTSIAIGDLNGDGKPDVVISNVGAPNAQTDVGVLMGNGDGTFGSVLSPVAGFGGRFLVIEDFNDDGRPDLAVANQTVVSILINNVLPTAPTTNGLSFVSAANYGAGTRPISTTDGDFNGDGKTDLAVANRNSNNVSVLLGNGDGTLQPAQNFAAGTNPFSVAVGDFNGDGKPDLVVANANGNNVSVLLGNGNGTFQAAVNYNVGSLPAIVAVADFNGDGRSDLAVPNTGSNTVSVLLGNGNGTFQAAQNFSVGTNPVGLAVGDFNADGKPDLVVANSNSNNVTVLLGIGNGTFSTTVNYNVGLLPDGVAIGDFNGDGKLDLAVANSNSNNVSVLLGSGGGTFNAAVSYAVGSGSLSVFVGDFNGDGKPDLATSNAYSDNVSVLLGKGDGTFEAAVNYAAGSAPYSVTVGDFNGDGKPDLAVPNMFSNNVSVLLNAGGSTALTVTSAAPAVFGQSVDLTATIAKTLGGNTPSGTIQFQDGVSNFGSAVNLSGSSGTSTAVLATSALSAGTHIITALYSGDTNFWTNTAQQITQVVNQASTTTAVASLNSPSAYNTSVTLQATIAVIAPGTGTPTGTVQFKDGGTNLGSPIALDPSGIGQLVIDGTTIPFFTAGTHSITAVYSGDINYIASTSSAFSEVVNKADPVITWTDPAAITYGTALSATQLNASANTPGAFVYSTVSGTVLNTGTQTLSVTFTPTDTANYSAVSATVSLNVNQAALTITGNNAARNYGAGNPALTGTVGATQNGDVITATYATSATPASSVGTYAVVPTPAGAALANYNITLVNGALTVNPATLTITADGASRNYGAANPVSAVSVGGIQNGDMITASTSISATSTSPVGTYAIVPIASGVALGNYAVTTNNGTLTITQAPSVTGVGLGSNPILFSSGVVSIAGFSVSGTVAIVTAKVSSTTSGTPTGTVTFKDGSTILGTAIVDPFGLARFSTSALAVGSHSIFAVYAGDTNFIGSTSAPINLTVSASGAVTLSSSGLTFGYQFPGTFSAVQNVTLTNTGAGTLIVDTLITSGDFFNTNNCGSLSAGASCLIRVAFSPSQLGASTGALIITSNAPSRIQSIPLTGTGTDISIAFSRPARPSRSAASIIVAGQSARMELNLATTNSASGKVALTCSGAPLGATCSVFPETVDLSGAGTPITVVVNTTARPLQRAARLFSFTRASSAGTSPGNYALHITATTRVRSGSVDLPISVK